MPSNSAGADRFEQRPAVDAADQRIDQILRMRHQAEHVEALAVDARDVVDRAVRVGLAADPALGVAITECDAPRSFELGETGRVNDVIALAVGDCELYDLATRI